MGSCICADDPQELKPSETLLANDGRNMGNFQANLLIVHQTACGESEIATVEWIMVVTSSRRPRIVRARHAQVVGIQVMPQVDAQIF
ncbi:hypothetical protein AeMF1_016660, partial [Aphanomyces euteiches]